MIRARLDRLLGEDLKRVAVGRPAPQNPQSLLKSDSEDSMSETVIVSAVRVPTGRFLGSLKDFTAPQLGAMAVREAVARAGIDPASASTNA